MALNNLQRLICHHHHHHHIALVARIFLTLSRHSSLSFIALGRSSGQHPVSSDSCWMYVRAGRPAFARPCVGVHKSTISYEFRPCFSSSCNINSIVRRHWSGYKYCSQKLIILFNINYLADSEVVTSIAI